MATVENVPTDQDAIALAYARPGVPVVSRESGDTFEHPTHAPNGCVCETDTTDYATHTHYVVVEDRPGYAILSWYPMSEDRAYDRATADARQRREAAHDDLIVVSTATADDIRRGSVAP